MSEIIGWTLLGIGLSFNLFGTIGLVRMPDLYCRLQAATKCVTFGTGSVLFGAFLISGFTSIGIKALVCLVFLFLNVPTASHALARAYHMRGVGPQKNLVFDKLRENSGDTK
jgi:multicomponent Na+:H+ antiporter subunit G